MSYRDPGEKDTYIIDERPIIKRVIQMPKFPKWIPGVTVAAITPVIAGYFIDKYEIHTQVCEAHDTALSASIFTSASIIVVAALMHSVISITR